MAENEIYPDGDASAFSDRGHGMSQKPLDIDDVILKIHAAPLEPQGWRIVIEDLLKLCTAEKAVMLTVGLTPASKPWELSVNFNAAALQEYATHWASQDLL